MADSSDKLTSITKSRRRFLKAAGVATATGLAGCSQQSSDDEGGTGTGGTTRKRTTTTERSTTTKSVDSATVGVLTPLSGPFSQLGKSQKQAAQVAVDWANATDELDFELNAVYEDTQTKASTGRKKAQKLVQQDGVDYLAGCINSSVALAVVDYVGNEGVPYVSGGAALEITGKNCNRYTFRNESNTAMQAAGLVDYAATELGSDWWIHTADYAYGNSAITQIEQRIEEGGYDVEIRGRTKPTLGTENFGPYISQISNSEANVLAIPLTGGDLINFMKQAKSAGLQEEVDIIGTAIFAQVIRGALGSAAYGTYSSTLYNRQLETGDNQQFVESFKQKHGSPPGHFSRVGYDAVRMPARAIQMANSTDPDDIVDTMEGVEMTTALGKVSFRECDHQALNPIWTSKMNEPDSGRLASVEILNRIKPGNAVPDCSKTNCDL